MAEANSRVETTTDVIFLEQTLPQVKTLVNGNKDFVEVDEVNLQTDNSKKALLNRNQIIKVKPYAGNN